MIKEAIIKLSKKEDLTYEMAETVMDEIMSGEASPVQMSAYLTALAMKGETIDEITASAAGMRAHCIKLLHDMDGLEIVGTGGDGSNSFNISTTASLVIAAGGVPVAKHGNRSISSKSGAGDVLEALGVNIMADPKKVEECVEKTGIGFMFAQLFNKSMRYVGQARSEMGIRTVFNILGPLANPSRAKNMVVGVYSPSLTEKVATAMSRLGVERAYVVSGEDNMDEITLTGATTVSEIRDGAVTTFTITPEQFGMKRVSLEELRGGSGGENAKITRDILDGTERGAKRDIVLLNTGATLYVGGVAESMEAGVKLAAETIDTGAAYKKLEELVTVSNR